MKFEFTFNAISGTINGAPITIDGTKVSCEISAQELATYGGVITSVLDQFKDIFKNTTPTPAPMPAPVVNVSKMVEPTPSPCPCPTTKRTTPTDKKVIDVNTTFEELEEYLSKRRGWSSDHMGHLNYKSDTVTEGAEFREVEIVLDSAIRLHFMRNSEDILKTVHIHVYPNRVYVSGIAPYYLERFLKGCGVIGLDHLWDVVKGMEVKNS